MERPAPAHPIREQSRDSSRPIREQSCDSESRPIRVPHSGPYLSGVTVVYKGFYGLYSIPFLVFFTGCGPLDNFLTIGC